MLFDHRHELVRELVQPLRVKPGSRVKLPQDFDPGHTGHFVREADADEALRHGVELLAAYQSRLAAERTRAVLLVLQALDAAGKDGAIKHVMGGVNPQGVRVHSFKVPTDEELHHDYLWRYQCVSPAHGEIAIFNRSHYEEALVVRVHPDLLERQGLAAAARKGIWRRRFREINQWERHLVASGIHVVKVFLNVSREEQAKRLLARIDDPEKNWKFQETDIVERGFWDAYQSAYSDVLSRTSTKWAPWYVVPADNKWFARLAVAGVLIDELMRIDPEYPSISADQHAVLEAARKELAGG